MNAINQLCRYCGHSLQIGETEDLMQPACAPSIRVGVYCPHCGAVESGRWIDEGTRDGSR